MPEDTADATEVTALDQYMLLYVQTRNAVIRAKAIFEYKSSHEPTLGLQAQAAKKALEAERKLNLLVSAHEAFMHSSTVLNPPSQKDIENAVELARLLSSDIAKNMAVTEILTAVNNAIKTFNDYQKSQQQTA